ncbi:hypothetical protein Bca4012_065463 [Brassica carinata]
MFLGLRLNEKIVGQLMFHQVLVFMTLVLAFTKAPKFLKFPPFCCNGALCLVS